MVALRPFSLQNFTAVDMIQYPLVELLFILFLTTGDSIRHSNEWQENFDPLETSNENISIMFNT